MKFKLKSIKQLESEGWTHDDGDSFRHPSEQIHFFKHFENYHNALVYDKLSIGSALNKFHYPWSVVDDIKDISKRDLERLPELRIYHWNNELRKILCDSQV